MSDFRVIHWLTWHHFVHGRVRADSSLAWAVQALQQLAVSECVLNVLLITLRYSVCLWVHGSNMRTAEALSRCFRFLPCSWPGPCPLLHCTKKCSDITSKLKSFPSSAVCISPHWKYMRKKKKETEGGLLLNHIEESKKDGLPHFSHLSMCVLSVPLPASDYVGYASHEWDQILRLELFYRLSTLWHFFFTTSWRNGRKWCILTKLNILKSCSCQNKSDVAESLTLFIK